MGVHEDYAKEILQSIAKTNYNARRKIKIILGKWGWLEIDGTIKKPEIAIEIEGRNEPQVIIAVLKLIMHDYKKKLLILVPVNKDDIDKCKGRSSFILDKFGIDQSDYQVIILKGSGHDQGAIRVQHAKEDFEIIKNALELLGFHESIIIEEKESIIDYILDYD